jgi:excisionase family DNA binding protein
MGNRRKHKQEVGTIKASIGDTDDVLLFDNNLGDFSSPLLTLSEVAEFLKISVTGVRRLQQQRHIPFLKVGGSVRFLKEDLIFYLRKQRMEVIEY